MDATLSAVLVGSAASLVSTALVNWLALVKEEKQWNRQALAEDKRRERDLEVETLQRVRDAYSKCVGALSTLISLPDGASSESRSAMVQEAHASVAMALLAQDDAVDAGDVRQLAWLDGQFAKGNDRQWAISLRDHVVQMATNDPRLYSTHAPEHQPKHGKSLRVEIDPDFRRSEFIHGREMQLSYTLHYDPCDLTPSQREKLWDRFSPTYQGVPEQIKALPMPDGTSWTARVNPDVSSTAQIFAAWESDYTAAGSESVGVA